MSSKGLVLLVWVFFVHLAGIYLYTRGFLLTRLSLSERSGCEDGSCTLQPTHKRAVVLIIDALRFDFVSPDPPQPPSPYYHNVVTLPGQMTAAQPSQSFLFDTYADPPTTTLQRIKGITTGSLPTFVDVGFNFGAMSTDEDSWVSQVKDAGKNVAFMGDATWSAVFSDKLAPDMTFPFDSFNAEDLHTVDNGVIRHLLPLMSNASAPWDIDLVPSLSLLLGLPIPYNNLGMVIPELFWRDARGMEFENALDLNAQQVKRYLNTYRAKPAGGELDSSWAELQERWVAVEAVKGEARKARLFLTEEYVRAALEACRLIWARFNVSLIVLGLVLLAASIASSWVLYVKFGEMQEEWGDWAGKVRRTCVIWTAVGAVVGCGSYFPLRAVIKGVDALQCVIFCAPFASSLAVVFTNKPSRLNFSISSLSLPLILHALSFAWNSLTFWEDRVVTFLVLSSIVPSVFTGFTAPTARLRYRILGFSALFAACVWLMAMSTVCKEEHQPYCYVTFFASSSFPEPPLPVLKLSLAASIGLSFAIRAFLMISKSDKGIAPIFLSLFMPGILHLGAMHWIMEWLDSAEVLGPGHGGILRADRTSLARNLMGIIVSFVTITWRTWSLCLGVSITETPTTAAKSAITNDEASQEPKKLVTILGSANTFGASYLLLWCMMLCLLSVATQLTGQLVLGLATLAVLAHVEVVDSVRDVHALEAAFPSETPSLAPGTASRSSELLRFSHIVPLALLALHTFYATGHQSTISSIQWKSAFVLTSTFSYPFSPFVLILNTFGPQFLIAFATPLLALWNVLPLPQPKVSVRVRGDAMRAGLGMMLYHSVLLLASAVCAAWLRGSLTVWKVFAPRLMSAAASLVAIDLAILLGVGLGVSKVAGRVSTIFGPLGSGRGLVSYDPKTNWKIQQ
ncbi:uncharacterized protein LAESUDRAFT_717145 [Laetiporus sulphureus 93-53]|uniref:GPI ethanolamine phosphate transferase 1 n=1 Tax=Laetiporus sulphureus 93-53 TaxID=1314785 RepID=A0A165C067_9APHY|nr:uncharacterized protein LAESUDRAFT_717145 [Laetiporus sulphureus 93-53]KZT01963.1 hypothetical protein LAESUDRAFT_717145 [Laetiporus sulphureus 93-53]